MSTNKFGSFSMLAVIILSITACGSSNSNEVITEDRFKVMIPDYMTKTIDLNDVAILQYQNTFKEIYFMVIEDEKEEFHQTLKNNNITAEFSPSLDGFFKLMINKDLKNFITIDDRDKVKDEKIHGLNAKTYTNTRSINAMEIYYSIALIEGKNHYYQVIAWTLADKKDKNEKALHDMVYSFEEL